MPRMRPSAARGDQVYMAAIFGLRGTNYSATDSPEGLLMREDYLWRDRVSVQLV